jgi:serine/threonine-protein kinase
MGAAAHDSRTGELLNKSYELHELIEPGGVADTYRATDRKRSRTVKVTLLRPEFALQSSVVQGFLSMPKTLTGLRHPNVSQVIAVESDETGIPFVVEEHVEGEPLARTISAFPEGMPVGVAMNVVMPVIEAMAAAHKLGLVHGQLDHEHVVLTKTGGTSVPKIVRFGSAAARGKPTPKGSERRTAPELRAGKPADLRSDVWALGALLYETLCGESPAITSANHVALDERAPHLPAELSQLIERCLAAEPGRRPKQAEEVRAALAVVRDRLRAGTPPSQVEPRIGKAAGAVQAEPRVRKSVLQDARAAASLPPRVAPARPAPAPAAARPAPAPAAARPATPARPASAAAARPATPARPAPAPAAARPASPPRPVAAIRNEERPTAEVPGLSELARARARRMSSAPPIRERAQTPMAFAPEAEITFDAEPAADPAAPEASFEDVLADDPFAKRAVPSLPPAAPSRRSSPARAPAPSRAAASPSAERSVGRKTAAGRDVALPALDKSARGGGVDDAFAATFEGDAQFALSDTAPGDDARPSAKPPAASDDAAFDATFDDAFAEAPQASALPAKSSAANVALDLMPPPLPPPPAGMDTAAARAFGLGATMMQSAPSFDAATMPGDADFADLALPEPTAVDDDEPEMTLEPAAQSLPPKSKRPSRPSEPDIKTMSDLAAAFGPIEGEDRVGQGETEASARGRQFRKKLEQEQAETAAKRAKKKDKEPDKERKSAPGGRPSRPSGEQRIKPAAPIGSPKQLRQSNTISAAKLNEDQARALRDRVQQGERRRWRVFGGLLMLPFCFGLILFVPLLYDPTHIKAQEKLGPNLKVALSGLMIVSVMTVVRTWVVQVQSKPMMMKPMTWTMKVVVLCVCVLAMTFFLPAGALGPAEAAARAALPWATSGFYFFLGIYGMMLGIRESANNMMFGVMLMLMYGAGFGGAYRALFDTVLQKKPHAEQGAAAAAGSAASSAAALHDYVTGTAKLPEQNQQDEPMQQQHEVGGSEEEDMRSIEQLKGSRKSKGEQFDDLHKNMEKMVH